MSFYVRLFQIAPGVRHLFPEDMTAQRRKLADTLNEVVNGLSNMNRVMIDLGELAERHAGYGAKPQHYPVVGEALIWALKETLGEEFTAEHEQAWTDTYEIVSAVMIEAQSHVPAV